jgi:hypothetical protein
MDTKTKDWVDSKKPKSKASTDVKKIKKDNNVVSQRIIDDDFVDEL